MTTARHTAELEVEGTDMVAAWNALEPVIAQCAGSAGNPAMKSDYHVGRAADRGTVTGGDLRDCLDQVGDPTSISITYTTESRPDLDPYGIELKIMRYRRFRELNVHLRVTGPPDVQTLGYFERTKKTLAATIDRLNAS